MAAVFWIDNRDVANLGLRVARWNGFLTGGRGEWTVVGVPGGAGQLVGTRQAASPRLAALVCYMPLTAVTDHLTAPAAVEAAVSGGIRTLRAMNRPTLRFQAVLQSLTWSEVAGAPGLTVPSVLVEMQWLLYEGGGSQWPAPGPVLLGTSATAITLGTLPMAGWLLVWGSSSPLTITYTPANGVGATTCVITGTLAAGGHWACELATGDVWQVAADGSRARATSVVGSLPALDPAHVRGTRGPSVTLSSGTGILLPDTRYRA